MSEPLITQSTLRKQGHNTSLFGILKQKRGWDKSYIEEINNPAYDQLLDIDKMTDELHKLRLSGELIVVLPDFDMDGITAGTLGYAGLSELGFNVALYVPDYERGHDVTPEAVQELKDQFPDAKAVITCDGGVNSLDGMTRGKELGMTMLVTDHHVQLERADGRVSDATVIVDPERIDETYAHPGICGAFVFYQVLMHYAQHKAPHKVGDISLLKLFAGIGTVSDVMPLFYENRQVVKDSLSLARLLFVNIPAADTATEYDIEKSILMMLLRAQEHHPAFVSVFEGFALMMQNFKEYVKPMLGEDGQPLVDAWGKTRMASGKLRSMNDLNEEFYGFYLAPAFNAVRRIGGKMSDTFGVFTAPTVAEKNAHARAIIDGNDLRKELTETYMEELLASEQPLAPYVYLTDAPLGMLGLLAAKIMHETDMPVAVMRHPKSPNDPVSGSARSPFWFPIIETMTAGGFRAIGHENACGVEARNSADLELFVEHMRGSSEALYAALLLDGSIAEAQRSDLVLGDTPECDASLTDIEELMDMTQCIAKLAPFGHGFPRPEFELVLDLSQCNIDTLGADAKHVKIILRNGLKLLWWNSAEALSELKERAESPIPGESTVRAKVGFSINVFMGHESVQGVIQSLDLAMPDEVV